MFPSSESVFISPASITTYEIAYIPGSNVPAGITR